MLGARRLITQAGVLGAHRNQPHGWGDGHPADSVGRGRADARHRLGRGGGRTGGRSALDLQTRSRWRSLVAKVIDYARRARWTKLGVLYSADAYGEDGRDNMRKLAPAAGVTIAREESFAPTATDLKPQLTKLWAGGVDAIFMHGLGAPGDRLSQRQ